MAGYHLHTDLQRGDAAWLFEGAKPSYSSLYDTLAVTINFKDKTTLKFKIKADPEPALLNLRGFF